MTTVLDATALSLNCAYLRMAHDVGLPNVLAMARRLGLSKADFKYVDPPPRAYPEPSLTLGAAGVPPIEMADAYATLASGGIYHAPQFVNRVLDRTGRTIWAEPTVGRTVLAPNIVAEADQAFQAVVQYGTGTSAALTGRPLAGKTGTDSGPRDAWFNGYTPQLETTVWMGNPAGGIAQMLVNGSQVYGASYPAPTVRVYMNAALAGLPAQGFPAVDNYSLPAPYVIPEVTGPTPPLTPPTTQPVYVAPAPTRTASNYTPPTYTASPTPTTPTVTAPTVTAQKTKRKKH